MSRFRQVEIEQIKDISNICGLPLPEFENMSDRDIAGEWMKLYETYPFYFGEE